MRPRKDSRQLGTLAGAEVDVRAVADFFAPLGDVAPGL